MAWDAPRRCDPLPRTLGRPFFSVDELDFHKTALEVSRSIEDANLNMHGQLSPIEEERRFPTSDAPLQVHVTVKFHDPTIRFTYNRTYCSSQSFNPTDRICRGLMRRIEHCSEEAITRKDSDALNATQCLRKGPKPLRFELSFEVARGGHSGIWAERSFKSYQKHAFSSGAAKEVLRSTHRIVGVFLRRHDKGFEWTDEPAHDYFPDKPETFKPALNGTLSLACVPRSLFIESHQTWEFVPGYTMELTFKSSNPARQQFEIKKTLKVDSEQNTPLNLGLSEDLLWQAHKSVQDVLDQKKSSFDLEHANCDGFDGVPDCDCQHFDENALDVELRVINNLGPVYDHLHRNIQSRLRLFTDTSGRDCKDFVRSIQTQLSQFRNRTDKKVERLNDFDFRIAELTGHGWHEKDCARFIIDGKHNYSRRSIQALLDRIRTGVGDILRGNDVAIRMIAYKRGHLILDKALIARDHQSSPGLGSLNFPEKQQQNLLGELKTRIQDDIDMICKDTCSIDDIHEVDPEIERELCRPRPAFASGRPSTPRNISQRQNLPGSPGSFATQPPTPPQIPSRNSSRVFPLVPAKYQEKEKWPSRGVSSTTSPAVDMNCDGDLQLLNSSGAMDVSSTHSREHIRNIDGLKPAAEVYPTSKEEYETDSSSTHSSMPALTESDTPSPEHSMLITPSCVRSSSPIRHGLLSNEDLRNHHFFSPFVMNTSAPSSTTFSDVEHFEDPNAALPRKTILPSGRPGTPKYPDIVNSVPVNTPKPLGDVSGDEKTPVPHRCIQGSTGTDKLGDDGNGLVSKDISPRIESYKPMSQSLPTKGWLFCHVEDVSSSGTSADGNGEEELPEPITECDSSETLRPSMVTQHVSIEDLAGLRNTRLNKNGNLGPSSGPEQVHPKISEVASDTQTSVPSEHSELNLEADLNENRLKKMTLDDELSRSKLDFFEQDEDSAVDTEMIGDQHAVGDGSRAQTGLRWMGMSERSDTTDHVIMTSNSGLDIITGSGTTERSGSEYEVKHVLSPIDEGTFEFGVQNFGSASQDPGTRLTEPEREDGSGPLDNEDVRHGEEMLPVSTKGASMDVVEKPESPSEAPESAKKGSTSAPTQDSDSVKLLKLRTPAPICTTRAASNPQKSPNHIGLGSAHLLPPLPIVSSFRSVSHDTRASWSTSSSWEDYISTGRQSSDSVDTIKASPADSEENGPPGSPKRLGTPTAGLLGLHESRWADFGIRTALTGTHAFDRLFTAPVSESPESDCRSVKLGADGDHGDDKMVQESPLTPRKSFYLKQKKNIGSIIMASNLKKKGSKELRNPTSVERNSLKKRKSKSDESAARKEDDDGAARFPRAMMLVAGLAFASSVVSRNHS